MSRRFAHLAFLSLLAIARPPHALAADDLCGASSLHAIFPEVTELRILNRRTASVNAEGAPLYLARGGQYISDAKPLEKYNAVFVDEYRGAIHEGVIVNRDGSIRARIPVAKSIAFDTANLSEDGRQVVLKFSSAVNRDVSVNYDIATQTFPPANYESALMTSDGKKFISELVEVQSKDGVKLPMRLTHLENAPLDRDRPVYMGVYGGLASSNGGVVPYDDPNLHDFLNRGAVIASPAIRGGDEFGKAWHEAGRALNKGTTLEDIHSSVQYLFDHGYSNSKKVILTGASIGGFASAAAALEHTESYGLVIP